MKLLSLLYENNLLSQQLSFKWHCLFYIIHKWKSINLPGNSLPPRKFLLYLVSFFFVYLADILVGLFVYICIQEVSGVKQALLKLVSEYTLLMLQWTNSLVHWIMGSPGGLKLNTPLNHFIGGRILILLDLWEYFYSDFIATYLDSILSVLLILLSFGFTLFLTALHDFLKFLHLCLICFFVFTSRIVGLQVSLLKSFTRLFMGSKWNLLRKRIDSCNYDTNQLLVGTIVFTILLFLLPTTGVYFALFLSLRLFQFVLQFLLRTMVVTLNACNIQAVFYLCDLLKDQPLTQLEVNVALRGHPRVPVKVQFFLNGKQYSPVQIGVIIRSTSIATVLQEIDERRSYNVHLDENLILNHPMLDIRLESVRKHLYVL